MALGNLLTQLKTDHSDTQRLHTLALVARHTAQTTGNLEIMFVWHAIQPLLANKALVAACLDVVAAMLLSHYQACDLLRKTFFDLVTSTDVPIHFLADLLTNLTRNGRDLRHIEHHVGPLLQKWSAFINYRYNHWAYTGGILLIIGKLSINKGTRYS